MTARVTPLIIDVDTGIDDAFALLYACAAPDADSSASRRSPATSTSPTRPATPAPCWRSPAAPRCPSGRAARRRCSASQGRQRYPRRERPRLRRAAGAARGRRRAAHADRRDPRRRDASTGALVLVATGPLTNIAAALLREPDLPRRLERFVLMGGAFTRRRQRHAGGGVQHLARSRSGAHRLSRLRRRRRGAADRRRPRRDATDAAAPGRSRQRSRGRCAGLPHGAGAAALSRRLGAPLFRD